jgi:arylsulfatase A-like enzyme
MVDQLRYAELAAGMSGISAVLPNITALQAQSVEFTNFFVAATCCTPSRAAFLTGLYPTQTTMYITQGNGAEPTLNTGFTTYADYLSETLGYLTSYFGKWHLSNESPDFGYTPNFSSYGFTHTGNETPSPDGFANEGVTGGAYANPPHEGSSGTWINDQEIVRNFAGYLSNALANQTGTIVPWASVVSLINPHDISSYPLFILNYCTVAGTSPSEPYYAPQTPNAAPTWAVTGTPKFPVLPALFDYTGAASPACSGTAYNSCTSITGGPNALPSNTSEQQGSPKPTLQQEWQTSIFAVNGSIGEPVGGPYPNGDWGLYLNVYYWLASCTDQLIGNLATPDSHIVAPGDSPFQPCTILGQVAALLGSGTTLTTTQVKALANTVIVFTADHGELGGAHSLPQKHACSYDEAINVPLFVHLPNQTANTKRTQMVSSVDFFGLICGLAQPTYISGVPTWQNANPQLSTRMDMIKCLESNSYTTSGRTISIGGVETPYIFHTYNEWFKINSSSTPWDPDDPCHVVCLRTAGQKLVYYDTWATGSYPQQTQFGSSDFSTGGSYATDWTTANAEYYVLSSNPTETGNSFETTTIHDIQTNFQGCVNSELQASLGSSFATAQSEAVTAFQTYITAPEVTGVTNSAGLSTITHGSSVTINIVGTGFCAGPTVTIQKSGGTARSYYIDDAVSVSPSVQVTGVLLASAGSYTATLTNPSGLISSIGFTVS